MRMTFEYKPPSVDYIIVDTKKTFLFFFFFLIKKKPFPHFGYRFLNIIQRQKSKIRPSSAIQIFTILILEKLQLCKCLVSYICS